MSLNAKQRYDLGKFVKELGTYRRRHTELITVYIPSGYDLNKIIQHLSQEQGTAANIKSSSTRKSVEDALEKMIQHLRLYKQTPQNGLAAFSGNIAAEEGKEDYQVWSIEPPIPLKTRLYRCDKDFLLDLLAALLESTEVYGLIVMDRREGDIALLKGKSIVPLSHHTSNVPGKTRAGGQSAARFERLREGAARDFYTRLGEHAKEAFLGKKELKGIIVGGPGPTKSEFVDGNFITNEVKKKIIGIKDLSYTGEFGLQELVDRSQDLLANEEIAKEKQLMQRFFDYLAKKPGMVSYGIDEVMKQLKNGAVETLLISEKLDEKKLEEFEKEALKVGTTVEIISTDTREGVQLRDFGMVASINRYEVE